MGFPGRPCGQNLPGGVVENWPQEATAGTGCCTTPCSQVISREKNGDPGTSGAVGSLWRPEDTHVRAQGDTALMFPSKGSGRQQERKGRRPSCLSNIWKWVVRGGGSWMGDCQGESESRCWRSRTTPHVWVSACGWSPAPSLVFAGERGL